MRVLKWLGIIVAVLVIGVIGAVVFILNGGDTATLPQEAGYGAHPTLPAPHPTMTPTAKFASAIGWPPGGMPKPADGLKVQAFAAGLDHPRWLLVLPNGDVLLAETNSPPKPDDMKGAFGFVAKTIMSVAGADTKSPNKIVLLRDTDGDGVADKRFDFLTGLNSPFGMTLVGDTLYVANTDSLVKVPYHTGDTHISATPVKVTDLPGGTINHHWTKNVIASPDGSKLYVTTGSNSNVGENGMAAEEGRAAIWEVDPATGHHRIFAFGIRNPNGMDFLPGSNTLWVTVNERDEIGSDLVPDYMTSVKDGGFYGWPYSYYGQHVDVRVSPQRPELVAKAIQPDYALGAHTASLGLTFSDKAQLGPAYAHGIFIGQHGSWNRNPRAGYRVIFVPFTGDKPSGVPQEVLTGFLNGDGKAQGRPVGVVIAKDGALLVADDVGNTVWRVSAR
jgi:glucose/arabinose dehydrogenase